MSEEDQKGAMHARATGQADYSSGDAYITSTRVVQEQKNYQWIAASGTGGSALLFLVLVLAVLFVLLPFIGVYSTVNNLFGSVCTECSRSGVSGSVLGVRVNTSRTVIFDNRFLDIVAVLAAISALYVWVARRVGPDLGSFVAIAIFASGFEHFRGVGFGETTLLPVLGALFGVLAGHLMAGRPKRFPGTWIEQNRRKFLKSTIYLLFLGLLGMILIAFIINFRIVSANLGHTAMVAAGGIVVIFLSSAAYLGVSHILRKLIGLGRS